MHRFICTIAITLIFAPIAVAQSPTIAPWDTTVRIANLTEDPRTHFYTQAEIDFPASPVPVVVEIPFEGHALNTNQGNQQVLVVNDTESIIPSFVKQTHAYTYTQYTVTPSVGNGTLLTDGSLGTGVLFPLPPDTRYGNALFVITPEKPFIVSGLTFTFERNVTTPRTVEVVSVDEFGNESIVLSRTTLTGTSVQFMPTKSAHLSVFLEYNQPVGVQELGVVESSVPALTSQVVRFLAQPGVRYTLFSNPDTYVNLPYQDTSHLMGSTGILQGSQILSGTNPLFSSSDIDADGVPDTRDNCPKTHNALQEDIDGNGIGDVCDDYDRDGYMNTNDNCPNIPNYQRDVDGDGIGDECDTEESRLTERLPWVPWVGMGIAGFVVLGLFIFVAIDMRNKKPTV